MNRAEFLKRMGLTGGTAWLGQGALRAEAPAQARPNILWVSTEDISPNLGCYGDPHAHTPTLDQLADEGIRFTNAFAAAPVCAPNRCCVITGMYPTTLGTQHMRSSASNTKSNPRPPLPGHIRCFSQYLREAGYYCTNNSKEDYNFAKPQESWDESSNTAHWRNRSTAGQPFFAVFNFTGTHESQVRASTEIHRNNTARLRPEQRQNPDSIVPPPFHPDTPVVRENWARYHELISALDYFVADRLRELEEDGLAENTIVLFWSDHGAGLPRCKRWLYDSGVRIPVIARIPAAFRASEHEAPGTVDSRLVSCVDFAPTMLRLAGVPVPAHLQGQAFLGQNQAPERRHVYAVRDRMDERQDTIRMVRDHRFKYIRNYQPFRPYDQFNDYNEQSPVMRELRLAESEGRLTSGTQWMARHEKPVEELYEPEKDPHELNNLAEKTEYQNELLRLRAEHEAWFMQTGDLGLLPEAELHRLGESLGNRHAILAHVSQTDPQFLQNLCTVACAAGKPGPDQAALLHQSMGSPHPSLRYWAVLGLGRLPDEFAQAKDILERAMLDESETVRIAAARALLEAGVESEAALDTLAAGFSSQNLWIQVQAAQAVDELCSKTRSLLPNLQSAAGNIKDSYIGRLAAHAAAQAAGA